MKKMSFMLSILVLAAMLLAACGGGANNQGNQGTPGTDVTMQSTEAGAIPGTGSDMTSTPSVGTGTDTGTATSTSGDLGTGTATSTSGGTGTDTTPQASATTGTGMETPMATATTGTGTGSVTGTSTPSANVPVTGAEHQFVLLSDILKMNVNDNSGAQVGMVTGVVINRSMDTTTSTGNTVSSSNAGSATPTAGIGKGTLTTPTTSASTSGSTGSTMAAEGNNPRVVYAIVQTSNTSGSTSGTGSNSGTATPTTGTSTTGGSSSANTGEVLVPWEAFDFSDASTSTGAGSVTALNLNSDVNATALTGAPNFDETAVTGSAWDTDITAYWSGQGLGIPATGAETAIMEPVVVRGNFGSVNVVDASGKTVSQVRDLVIDATTGEVMYAILGGGSTNSGSSMYVVPVNHLTWNAGQGQGQGANTMGDFTLNFDASQFSNAPTINSVSDLDFSGADWNSEYDTYWSGVSTNP